MTSEPADDWPIDDGGYRVTAADLEFLGLDDAGVRAMMSRLAPLGMSPARFELFIEQLQRALSLDEITYVDVRLKGSAADFFSGKHKPLPSTKADLQRYFEKETDVLPDSLQIDELAERIASLWPTEEKGSRPSHRMFDLMHSLLGDLHPHSDYDIQVSSDELVDRATAYANIGTNQLFSMEDEYYHYIDPRYYPHICPALLNWASLQTKRLNGRHVDIVVFPSGGPDRLRDDSVADPRENTAQRFARSEWRLNPHG